MKTLSAYLLGASLLTLTACSPQSHTPETSVTQVPTPVTHEVEADINLRFDAWLEDKFMENIRRFPEALAGLGIRERMDEWNDPSYAFAQEQWDITRANMAYMKANFDRDALDANRQLSYDLFLKNAETTLQGESWWYHRYPLSQMRGQHASIPTFLINQHKIKSVDDARNDIARLNGISAYLGTVVDNSRQSAERGIMPPAFVYDHVIRAARNITAGAPFGESRDSTMLADFRKKVDELKIDTGTRSALMRDARQALLTSVKPAYDGLITEMERQKALAGTDDGAWKHPSGADYYTYRLGLMTTTDMSADDIHNLGLSEMARIHSEMQAIMDQVGFEGSLQDFFTFLKDDPRFTYEDSDAGRQAYLDEATRIINVMETRLDEVFRRRPKAALEVKRVEAFREKGAGKAFYNRPAADGSRPGYYYANLYKISDMPKYQMEALAYHEGVPGHHMQIAISQELDGVPKFRKFGGYTAYTEGWGLYSEYLPKEMGFYADPYSDFGRLAMELWRAARLVVDTGLHAKKWTREEAIQYLLDNTPNPENDCRKAIERYIVMPAQATAYKIGMIKIQELREAAKAELGDAFDIRDYHEVVLASGPVPLDVLEARVKAWVDSQL